MRGTWRGLRGVCSFSFDEEELMPGAGACSTTLLVWVIRDSGLIGKFSYLPRNLMANCLIPAADESVTSVAAGAVIAGSTHDGADVVCDKISLRRQRARWLQSMEFSSFAFKALKTMGGMIQT
jgi:hypothetical protein